MGLMRSLLFENFVKIFLERFVVGSVNIDEVDVKRWQLVEDFYLFPYFPDFQEVIVGLKLLLFYIGKAIISIP